jgi:hypothetical protein
MTREPNAPPVDLALARIFQDRADVEAYIARRELDPRAVAILPTAEGPVLGHVNPETGALLGYEA